MDAVLKLIKVFPLKHCRKFIVVRLNIDMRSSSSSYNEGQGLFSPVGQDRQWVHRPSPEKVLLARLGTKHLALC